MRRERAGRARQRPGQAGFTLLEVLVATVILAVAVTALLELAGRGLRLLHAAGEHQEALHLADRLLRDSEETGEGVTSGSEGPYAWERRLAAVPVPEDLTPPGQPAPRLLALTVTVRWSPGRAVELATLRALPAAVGGTP
jgi:general secretion pathway protein I